MPYARRTDRNHREVIAALEAVGFTVVDLSAVGRGVPDLWVAKAGRQLWLEVKDGEKPPSERKLTRDQVAFHAKLARAGVPVVVLTSLDQVAGL